uniref:AlNc14C78G5182 protein n=1 Tax=Albugo laibachii Nc14 TaxID=890382 RepID=F0WEY4_9STRA|nr:AlNc14C78G5182 [Albugo laibachii Nc14]|eukprot:CCA19766.1 AlNc14C78G5182 [Albugo laibachii Nc14]
MHGSLSINESDLDVPIGVKENKVVNAKSDRRVNETFLKLQASLNASWKPNNPAQRAPKSQTITVQKPTSDSTPEELEELAGMTAVERLRYRRKKLKEQSNARLEADTFLAEVNENMQKKHPTSDRIVKVTLQPSPSEATNAEGGMESALHIKKASMSQIINRAHSDARILKAERVTKESSGSVVRGNTTQSIKRESKVLSQASDRIAGRRDADSGSSVATQKHKTMKEPSTLDKSLHSKASVSLTKVVTAQKKEEIDGKPKKREQEINAINIPQHINVNNTFPVQPTIISQPSVPYPLNELPMWNAYPPPPPIYHPYGMYPVIPIAAFPMPISWPSSTSAYQSFPSVKRDRYNSCHGVGLHLVQPNGLCAHCDRLQAEQLVAREKLRQRCTRCSGWGLGLLHSNGKCGHCNRAGYDLVSKQSPKAPLLRAQRQDFSDSSSDWDSFSSGSDT